MKDFDKRFQEQQDSFDRTFKIAGRLSIIWFAFVAALACALLSGTAYAIYKLFVFFGVM